MLSPKEFIEDSIQKIKEQIGDEKAIIALSGGVDSSVCSVLVQEAIGDNKARITDTRKTTPGFRMFEKYAVFTGGARLHRFNLS